LGASEARARPARITAGLVWFHRWLGIATCLVFALWFASGAVLLFKPFPSLSRTDQLALAAPIDTAGVAVSPAQAMAAAGVPASGLRLVQRGGAAAYLVEGGERTVPVDARSGHVLPLLPPQAAGAKGPAFDYDQWIVHNHFDPYRPVYRIAGRGAGGGGTDLYISAVTGEAVQRTTAPDRAWNWAGAVLHWVYFTPLRSSFAAWDWSVWILSFIAMLVAVAGTILGVIRTLAALRQRKPSLSFFRLNWLRWHHLLGLFASIFVLSWILSGWLSMDHGRLFDRGQPGNAQAAAYAGRPLHDALEEVDFGTIRHIRRAREIGFTVVGGQAVINAYDAQGRSERFNAAGRPIDDAAMTRLIVKGAQAAWPAAQVTGISPADPSGLYAHAEGWPPSAWHVRLTGGAAPDLYADGQTGQILTVMSNSRASYAWIYYALHTFSFPGLITRPWLRQTLILIPLALGFLFSVTGVVIGWQRLRKSI
jgi:uncharacterized iron-regulated membrane protein